MVMWLGVTLGVAFGSALFPFISVEIFVLGLVASENYLPWSLVAGVVAIGQIAGKLFYYLAARGSIRMPRFLQNRANKKSPARWRKNWQLKTQWLREKLAILREYCHQHPKWMVGTYGVSAVVGLPPFMATTILAGLVRMPLSIFLIGGLLGRFARFSVLASAPMFFSYL